MSDFCDYTGTAWMWARERKIKRTLEEDRERMTVVAKGRTHRIKCKTTRITNTNNSIDGQNGREKDRAKEPAYTHIHWKHTEKYNNWSRNKNAHTHTHAWCEVMWCVMPIWYKWASEREPVIEWDEAHNRIGIVSIHMHKPANDDAKVVVFMLSVLAYQKPKIFVCSIRLRVKTHSVGRVHFISLFSAKIVVVFIIHFWLCVCLFVCVHACMWACLCVWVNFGPSPKYLHTMPSHTLSPKFRIWKKQKQKKNENEQRPTL